MAEAQDGGRRPAYDYSAKFVGARIQQARLENRMTRADVADPFGMSPSWISEVEAGRNRVDAVRLWKISQMLNRPLHWFIDPDFHPSDTQRPSNPIEWKRMYPDQPIKAEVFAAVDAILDRHLSGEATPV